MTGMAIVSHVNNRNKMEEEVKGLADYLAIVRRRKYWILFPALLLIAATVITVLKLPATYKSEGLILIESQEIPNDLIKSTVTSYADQRIEVIKQRIMTTEKVMAIVNKYKLYPESRNKAPASQLVGIFRQNLNVRMVNANVTDPRSGRTKRASIAFTVSFMDQNPKIAQQVASELVTQFLDENVRTRTERATETTDFLIEEGNKFQRKVQLLEKKIAEFKDEYSDSLPELLEYNLSMVERLQQELADNQNQVMVIQDQILTMNMELTNLPAYLDERRQLTPGIKATTSEQQLEQALANYNTLVAKYSSSHPDVTLLKRQIDSLRLELGIEESDVESLTTELSQLDRKLSKLLKRYSTNHPDVKKLTAQKESLQNKLSSAQAAATQNKVDIPTEVVNDDRPINPIYLQIKSKVDSLERETIRHRNRKSDVKTKLADFENRVFQTHQVKRAYDDLTRDHANNLTKYKELRAKQLEAELGQNLESENKGESFTLIEPPQVPSKAEKPNRPKLMLVGIAASIGVGLGLALLIEMIEGKVRGYNELSRVMGQAPLVVVPFISTLQDEKIKKATRVRIVIGLLILFALSVLCFHLWVMNLEVFWFKLMRKISLL